MTSLFTLKQMQPGMRARVHTLPKADGHYRARLLAMGLTVGTEILVKRISVLGDPIEILVRGAHVSLRSLEAHELLLERIDV